LSNRISVSSLYCLKTLFYGFASLAFILSGCSVKKASHFTWGGGSDKLEQESMPESTAPKVENESAENAVTAQNEITQSPQHDLGFDEKKHIAKPRASKLKQKIKAVSAAKKVIKMTRKMNAPSSEEDTFAAIMLITGILAIVVLIWGLLAIGVSLLAVILILVFILGLALIGASG